MKLNTIYTHTNTVYQKFIDFLTKHKTYTAVALVVTVGLLLSGFASRPDGESDTYTVVPKTLTQSVSVSGSVLASKDVTLAFQSSGQVAYVGVRVGDKVNQGKVLATLSAGDAQASLLEAEALLANKQATLEQLQQGARPEELALKEQAVVNAKNSLSQVYTTLPDTIKNTEAIVTDVVKNKLSPLFVFNGNGYTLSFSSCDQRLQAKVEAKRNDLENAIAEFQEKTGILSAVSSESTIVDTFSRAYAVASLTNDVVGGVSQILLLPCSASNSVFDGYRTTLTTVKTSMSGLFADLASKKASLVASENTLAQATKDFDLAKAGTNPYTLKAQTALVSQAEAQVLQAKVNLGKTMIIAPFSGVVSDVSLTQGKTISQGVSVVGMIAEDGYEIEAKVPEIDIAKVYVGGKVEIRLDAYGSSVVFPGVVATVSPVSTTEGSVPVYKVTTTFASQDSRIKAGMTANIKMITSEKTNIYAVPARFITIGDDGKGKAIILRNGDQQEAVLTLGIRGDVGLIEVREGLLEGDVLLPPTTSLRQAQKQTTK